MELKEELLDEENEKILSRLDNMSGLSKNKSILRNIIRFSKLMNRYDWEIKYENYNIIIRNESAYNLYEELISVIAEIYYKNKIILNPKILYLNLEKIDVKSFDTRTIEEGIIVINFSNQRSDLLKLKNTLNEFIDRMPEKAFIILEDYFIKGEVNAILNRCASWAMKIESISTQEKEQYIKKFMHSNKLIYSNEIIKELSNKPYWKIKNDMINIFVNCKMKNENDVSKILKIDNNKFVKKQSKDKCGLEELDSLIGLEGVKEQIKKVINYIKTSKNRKNMPMLHMCFNGNPGTGKTTVARIVGKIFAEEKILSDKNIFVEAQRKDLIAQYVGQTAPMTQSMIDRSLGGVLFIDEAYSIASYIQDETGGDYGAECVATLLKAMEDNRDNLCVILAGYTEEMEHLLNTNPGFESRIQFKINFPDYTEEELYEIFKQLCRKENYKLSSNIKPFLIEHFNKAKQAANFSNARYVRSIFEKIKIEQANRVSLEKNNINLIKKVDVENVISNFECKEQNKKVIGFAC